MTVILVELTLLLAAACIVDRWGVTRVRPQVRHGLWTIVALRLLMPLGLPGAEPVELRIDTATVSTLGALSLVPVWWMTAGWALGAAALAGRWTWQARVASRRLHALAPGSRGASALAIRLERTARRVGLARLPALHVDPSQTAPCVTGLLTVRLVLPADWRDWPEDALEHALAHELMHVVRRDLLVEALWMVIACVYWFHPLAHVARRLAHETREMCCDADVATRLGPSYRVALLRMMGQLFGECTPAVPGRHAWHPAVARVHALARWPGRATRRQRLLAVVSLLAAGAAVLPSHVRIAASAAPATRVEQLLDPRIRQELGLGSMHLRYVLLQDQTVSPEERPARRTGTAP